MMGPWLLTGLGGKTLKRGVTLDALRVTAREALAEGWPVFVRHANRPQHSIECKLSREHEVQYIPADGAPEEFVTWVTENFNL